jgi:hypothetical protein
LLPYVIYITSWELDYITATAYTESVTTSTSVSLGGGERERLAPAAWEWGPYREDVDVEVSYHFQQADQASYSCKLEFPDSPLRGLPMVTRPFR